MARTAVIAVAACTAAITGPGTAAQEQVTVLRAAWVIDASGRPPIPDGVVVVRGRRIEAVGPRRSTPAPAGAEVVDLPGNSLLPGLIDTHSHLAVRSPKAAFRVSRLNAARRPRFRWR